MPLVRAIFCLIAMLFLSTSVLADGKMFRFGVAETPAIPDQQAIIAWDAATSTETLAIETRFAATPSTVSYAWVVPLPGPAAPSVTAATPGLFPTTQSIFLPRVSDSGGGSIGFSIFLAVILTLAVWFDARQQRSWLLSLVLLVLLLTCIGGVLLPSLGKARSSAGGPAPEVEVLKRETIGSYDITIVGAGAARSDTALAAWFSDNGFALPESAAPILGEYAAKSWVFAAIKLRPDASASTASFLAPHPIVFTFKTAKPVYPMRLTGLDNGPLTLDLYIFGKDRAAAAGLAEIRCDTCRAEEADLKSNYRLPTGGRIGIGHPGLASIVKSLPVATKLSGTLSPAMQQRDMEISWCNFSTSGGHVFSPEAAVWSAIEFGAAMIPVFIVVTVALGAALRKPGSFALAGIPWAIPLAVVVAVIAWIATPTMPIKPGGRQAARMVGRVLEYLPYQVEEDLAIRPPRSAEDVRTTARARLEAEGGEWTEGDVPFGVVVRAGDAADSYELVTHNWCGAPSVERVWPPDPRPSKK